MPKMSAEASTNAAAPEQNSLDEERQLKEEVKATSVKVIGALPKTVKEQLETQTERIRNKTRRRRIVFEAICALIDPVSEEIMLKHLNSLDTASWAEVVEERFLGRLCGYPACDSTIQIDLSKKFVINHRKNKVYETDDEENKYCSDRCLRLSRAVRSQLQDQPLWITGARADREYVIPENAADYLKDRKPNSKVSISELVRHIDELFIADHPFPDDDEEYRRNGDHESEEERDEAEFRDSIKRYSTTMKSK